MRGGTCVWVSIARLRLDHARDGVVLLEPSDDMESHLPILRQYQSNDHILQFIYALTEYGHNVKSVSLLVE